MTAEEVLELVKGAQRNGWRFREFHGPLGTGYEGVDPRGRRVTSAPCKDRKIAFAKALQQARLA